MDPRFNKSSSVIITHARRSPRHFMMVPSVRSEWGRSQLRINLAAYSNQDRHIGTSLLFGYKVPRNYPERAGYLCEPSLEVSLKCVMLHCFANATGRRHRLRVSPIADESRGRSRHIMTGVLSWAPPPAERRRAQPKSRRISKTRQIMLASWERDEASRDRRDSVSPLHLSHPNFVSHLPLNSRLDSSCG